MWCPHLLSRRPACCARIVGRDWGRGLCLMNCMEPLGWKGSPGSSSLKAGVAKVTSELWAEPKTGS